MVEENEVIFYPEVINIGGSIGVIIPKEVAGIINLEVKDKTKIILQIVKKKNDNRSINEKGVVTND